MIPRSVIPLLLAVGMSITARDALAQQFEGVITAKMHGDATIAYSIKGDKLRADMTTQGDMRMATVVDRGARKMYMLMPAQQMYMERDFDTTMAAGARQQASADFSWTGTHQTIAGLTCDDATLKTNDGTQLNMCIAKGIAFAAAGPGLGRGVPRDSWQSHVQGGFPLKVQRAGDATPLMEVTNVDRKALADELFVPPTGWRKMTMPMGAPPRDLRPPPAR